MINIISVKCPSCNASVPIEEGREVAFCSHCGSRMIINNENKKEFVYRYVDEAGVQQAETERMVKMRELDIAEKQQKSSRNRFIIWLVALMILSLLGIIGLAAGIDGLSSCMLFAMMLGMLGAVAFLEKRKK